MGRKAWEQVLKLQLWTEGLGTGTEAAGVSRKAWEQVLKLQLWTGRLGRRC